MPTSASRIFTILGNSNLAVTLLANGKLILSSNQNQYQIGTTTESILSQTGPPNEYTFLFGYWESEFSEHGFFVLDWMNKTGGEEIFTFDTNIMLAHPGIALGAWIVNIGYALNSFIFIPKIIGFYIGIEKLIKTQDGYICADILVSRNLHSCWQETLHSKEPQCFDCIPPNIPMIDSNGIVCRSSSYIYDTNILLPRASILFPNFITACNRGSTKEAGGCVACMSVTSGSCKSGFLSVPTSCRYE